MADLALFLKAYMAGLFGFLVLTGLPFAESTAVPPGSVLERPADLPLAAIPGQR